MTDLQPLRDRIAALVAIGPIKARVAYAILTADGWTPGQIDNAKRGVVVTRGITKAAWWRARPPRWKRKRKAAVRPAVKPSAELPFTRANIARSGKCAHGFTVTTRRNGTFACALCEEAAA